MPIIGLTGKKFSGKTTAAELIRKYVYENNLGKYVEISFADPLKQCIEKAFNLDEFECKYLYDPLYKEDVIPRLGVTGRKLMQTIGTQLFKSELPSLLPDLKCKNIWVSIAEHKIKKHLDINTFIVISDVRFQDEADLINNYKGIIINIRSDETITSDDNHVSENQDILYDYTILNHKRTISDLKDKISYIMKKFLR